MNRTIGREALQAQIEAGAVTVVEVLPAQHYEDRHLPGALNINHDQVEELAPRLLPDKDAAIVTYCSNTSCQNSGIAQAKLQALGYTNVVKYAEGKQDWIEAGLPTQSGRLAA